jgi:hypothetical protein
MRFHTNLPSDFLIRRTIPPISDFPILLPGNVPYSTRIRLNEPMVFLEDLLSRRDAEFAEFSEILEEVAEMLEEDALEHPLVLVARSEGIATFDEDARRRGD